MKFITKTLIALLFLLSGQISHAQTTVTIDSTICDVTTVASSLDIPWEIKINPEDGMIWTTERYGVLSRIDPNTGVKEVLLNLSANVYQQSESGMLGMTFHPDFANFPYVFLVYTYVQGSIKERLVRYTWDGSSLGDELVLIEGIPGNTTHIGSRLIFLPDGTFIMTTGDAQNQPSSQDMNALTGKVLRFNIDGSIPADNPIAGNPMWSWGHRNAQGLVMAPNGIIYSSEHGPSSDDEFNILEMNKNYGWPTVHGFCDNPNENNYCDANPVSEPLVAWSPTIAPSDIIWYDSPAIPEFNGSILMAVLKNKRIIRLRFNAAGDVYQDQTNYFTNAFGRLRDVLQGPKGELYLATNGASWSNTNPNTHTIIKLTPRNMTLNAKVILEGPYDAATGLMTRDLADMGHLPLEEPYTVLPEFQHSTGGGGEKVFPYVLKSTDQNAVVDWVMVELRSASDNTVTVASRSALLQRDGDIVDLDGISPLCFNYRTAGDYYVVVKHRNHIAVMSSTTVSMSMNAAGSYDFTTGNAFGTDALTSLGNGDFGMFAGDADISKNVDASDRSATWNERNTSGYLSSDTDLDGTCDAADRSNTWNNRNIQTQVPE